VVSSPKAFILHRRREKTLVSSPKAFIGAGKKNNLASSPLH
jgi:hypothetical protein